MLDDYPRGPGSDLLNQLMSDSVALFADHPVNVARRAGRQAAGHEHLAVGAGTHAGAAAVLPKCMASSGAMITAVDLLRGLAALIGWRRIEVPGATGYLDTDYAAKGRYADRRRCPRPTSSASTSKRPTKPRTKGDAAAKIKALEEIDRHIVGPLHEALQAQGDYRILVTPDHPTPLRTKTHSHGAVPLAIAGSGVSRRRGHDLRRTDRRAVAAWRSTRAGS